MRWIRNISLKYKVPLLHFIITLLLGMFTYVVVVGAVEADMREDVKLQLESSTDQITKMIHIAVETSVRNQMRSVANVNKQHVEFLYNKVKSGEITESEARKSAVEYLMDQKIGFSGYLYILNSDGVVLYHQANDLIGADVSEYEFVQKQMKLEDQYIQYDWKNPGEDAMRPKALYMTYFEPWDWIITVTSYRDEFAELIRIEDFEKDINSLKFGETGYSFVLEENGKVLIHPFFKGQNINDLEERKGDELFIRLMEKKSGMITYSWSNQEEEPREKIAVINYLPEYKWMVASSGYTDEFYTPIRRVKFIIISGFFTVFVLSAIGILLINQSIVAPVNELNEKLYLGVSGRLNMHLDWDRKDEFGTLGQYFNAFMKQLKTYRTSMEELVHDKENALAQVQLLNDNLEHKVDERTDELKESIDQLHLTQQKLVHLEKMSTAGQIVTGMAHRLNTPLGTAITMISYMNRELIDGMTAYENGERDHQKLYEALRTAKTGAEMTERNLLKSAELIDVMKGVSGINQKGDASEVVIKDLLVDCIEIFKAYIQTGDYQVNMKCSESLSVVTGRAALTQVVTNLLSNSFKHGFEGRKRGLVNIAVHELDNEIEILYSDDGVGIENEYVEHVFNPFYRLDNIAKGAGLGLYIVNTAVLNGLQGHIECESSVGRGTRFRIVFPKMYY